MTLKLQLDHLLLQYILHLTGNKTISNRDDNLANRNKPVFTTSQGPFWIVVVVRGLEYETKNPNQCRVNGSTRDSYIIGLVYFNNIIFPFVIKRHHKYFCPFTLYLNGVRQHST